MEFEQALGDSEGQRSLVYYSPWIKSEDKGHAWPHDFE